MRSNSDITQCSSVRSQRSIALIDRGEAVGDLPGTAQGLRHLTQKGEAKHGVRLAEVDKAGAQQPQSADIAALHGENSLMAKAQDVVDRQHMLPYRLVEQRVDVTFRRRQIAGPQRDRARRVGKCETQRCYVISRASILNAAFGGAHRLIRKTLQPQDPREEGACRRPLIELEANDLGLLDRSDILSEHVLEVVPRTGLVAQTMLRGANQPVADQAIVRVGPRCPQDAEPLCQSQSDAMLTASGVKEPQAAERAQPVLGIVEALRYLKGLCPGRASLGNGTSGMYR
jgi:hypothetical protein